MTGNQNDCRYCTEHDVATCPEHCELAVVKRERDYYRKEHHRLHAALQYAIRQKNHWRSKVFK